MQAVAAPPPPVIDLDVPASPIAQPGRDPLSSVEGLKGVLERVPSWDVRLLEMPVGAPGLASTFLILT